MKRPRCWSRIELVVRLGSKGVGVYFDANPLDIPDSVLAHNRVQY
jgi:hypothetical protein